MFMHNDRMADKNGESARASGGNSTMGIVIGILIGSVIGAIMFDDIAIGIAFGVPLGIAIGMMGLSRRKPRETPAEEG
jgi:hypothetical protein